MLMCLLHQIGITDTTGKQRMYRQHILPHPHPSATTIFRVALAFYRFSGWPTTATTMTHAPNEAATGRWKDKQRLRKLYFPLWDGERGEGLGGGVVFWEKGPCLGQKDAGGKQKENTENVCSASFQ